MCTYIKLLYVPIFSQVSAASASCAVCSKHTRMLTFQNFCLAPAIPHVSTNSLAAIPVTSCGREPGMCVCARVCAYIHTCISIRSHHCDIVWTGAWNLSLSLSLSPVNMISLSLSLSLSLYELTYTCVLSVCIQREREREREREPRTTAKNARIPVV